MSKARITSFFILIAAFLTLPSMAEEEERIFHIINAANGLADNSAQIVKCTKTGRIIISTIGNLNFFDGKTFTHADSDQKYEYKLPEYRGHYHLYFDTMHHIWLKDKGKVYCLDLLTESFIQNVDSVIKGIGCKDKVLDMFVDKEYTVWFLTTGGLYSPRYKNRLKVLQNKNLQDVDIHNGTVYLFYNNGELVGQDTLGNQRCHTQPYDWNEGQKYASSSVLLPYKDGFFQIRNGEKESILLYFNTKTHSFDTLLKVPYHLNNMELSPDGQKLYLPCEYGYHIYTIATREVEQQKSLTLPYGENIETDCNTMTFDKQGGMWIGTEKRGVLYARPNLGTFKSYPYGTPLATKYDEMLLAINIDEDFTEYNGTKAYCQMRDSRGWKWIGTRKGLYIEKPGEGKTIAYTRKEGLNNDVIHAIVEDYDHNIWISTSCGISFFLIKDGRIAFLNNFTEADDVPSESFDNCRAMLLPDSSIIMKSVEHIVQFSPKDFKEVNTPHLITVIKPKLTRLLVNGNIVEKGVPFEGSIILDRAETRVKHINLKSDQNSVSLTFSALNYSRPKQTYYRVRVRELGNTWAVFSRQTSNLVDDKGQLHYPLANLEPGDYHIEVQASMFPDMWEENIPEDKRFIWEIHVKQPWWKTTGVFFLLGAVLMALLLVNFYFFNRNSRMKVKRSTEEGDIIRKIRFFIERCDMLANKPIAPRLHSPNSNEPDYEESKLSLQFINLMMHMIPYVKSNNDKELTMHQLSEECHVDIVTLYETMTTNLYKNPRNLVINMKLRRCAEMLRNTNLPIEQIATENGFYTPNYFIGRFFHIYKMTPQEYRERKL